MVQVKRKLEEYNELIAESCLLFELGDEELRVLVQECAEKIKKILSRRPRKVKCLKSLNRVGFDVNLAAEDFMSRNFETDSEADEVELKSDIENAPKTVPPAKRQKLSNAFKAMEANIDWTPSRIVQKPSPATSEVKQHFHQDNEDVSAIWFDKFMTQRKTSKRSYKEASRSDITGVLNFSVDKPGDMELSQDDKNAVFACKFTTKASWMLKNCFETISKIHSSKLSLQICKIKVRCVVPEEIQFTVVLKPGSKTEVITVIFKRPKKFGCFSFSKWTSTFTNEVQIGVPAQKIRDILKELKRDQSFGILIDNDGVTRCFMMLIGQSRKMKFKVNILGMEESPELANFNAPKESQTDNFDFAEESLTAEETEHHENPTKERAEDILAWMKFDLLSLKRDIDSLKTFGKVGELNVVKLPGKDQPEGGNDDETFWAEFKTESCGTEATIPMSKDTVHNMEIHIRENCEEKVLGQPVKLSLQILSKILSLKNIPTVKMDIYKYRGVGMFFKFSPGFGQGQVNYYFNQIDPNVEVQNKSQEISVEDQEIDSFNSFA